MTKSSVLVTPKSIHEFFGHVLYFVAEPTATFFDFCKLIHHLSEQPVQNDVICESEITIVED
jgi:phenylalanine-4-hydroxylase